MRDAIAVRLHRRRGRTWAIPVTELVEREANEVEERLRRLTRGGRRGDQSLAERIAAV